jgi:hypothetical protein
VGQLASGYPTKTSGEAGLTFLRALRTGPRGGLVQLTKRQLKSAERTFSTNAYGLSASER